MFLCLSSQGEARYAFWVHGCEPGRVSDGSRLALCQTLSLECPSSIFFWHVYFVILVSFSLSFLSVCVFLLLSLELGRCPFMLPPFMLPSLPAIRVVSVFRSAIQNIIVRDDLPAVDDKAALEFLQHTIEFFVKTIDRV